MIGILLSIIASILKWMLTPAAYIYGCIEAIKAKKFNKYNEDLAKSKDIYGNVLCSYLFNRLLKQPKGYAFGNFKETISSVLGKNERDGTLTFIGKLIAGILNSIQTGHCKNAIDNNV